MGSEPSVTLRTVIARLLIVPLAARLLRRRLRRAAGTDGLAWAVRLPLVTLPALALLVAVAAVGPPRG